MAGSFFDTKPLLTIWTPIIALIIYHLKTNDSKTLLYTELDYLLENTQIQVSEHKLVIQSKHSRCNSLNHQGKWRDFKAYGFTREVDNVTITSIYQPNYPFGSNPEPPHYDFSINQHFTGTWEGENCKIKKLTHTELKTCFKGRTKIKIFGDSRARQIYQSLRAYLKDSPYFIDEKRDKGTAIIPGILNLGYQWSNGIVNRKVNSSSCKKAVCVPKYHNYALVENIIKVFNADMRLLAGRKETGGRLIGIIGEHFLWTLMYWMNDANPKPSIIGNETAFVDQVFAKPFKNKMVPWIIRTIQQTTDVTLIFLGSHSSVSHHDSLEQVKCVRKLSQEHNRQLREIVENIGSERVKFVDSIFEIAQSPGPDFNPLVPDGTHMNVREDSKERFGIKHAIRQTDAQLAVNGVLLNTYCEGKLESNESSSYDAKENYCCF